MMLTIEDTGCGIPKEALSKLGRPFEQVQNQFSKNHTGSGLGLAISRSLAQLHGGALKIRSTQGVGTIVSVRIPGHGRKTETGGRSKPQPDCVFTSREREFRSAFGPCVPSPGHGPSAPENRAGPSFR